jgi:drug/metabolite transporter (DMT)-like permease
MHPITVEDCLPGHREHVAAQARAKAQSRWVWLAILPSFMGIFMPLLAQLHPGIPSRMSLTIGLAVVLVALLAAVVWAVKTALSDHRRNIESLPH